MSERENRLINETASEPWRVTSIVQHAAPVATVDGITLDLLALTEGSANPRAEMFLQGWARGYESRQHTIDRLTFERDQFYFVAFNKGKTLADFRAAHTRALWDQAVSA